MSLSDKPGDLDIIRREWHRSVNLSAALADRIDDSKHSNIMENLSKKCRNIFDESGMEIVNCLIFVKYTGIAQKVGLADYGYNQKGTTRVVLLKTMAWPLP